MTTLHMLTHVIESLGECHIHGGVWECINSFIPHFIMDVIIFLVFGDCQHVPTNTCLVSNESGMPMKLVRHVNCSLHAATCQLTVFTLVGRKSFMYVQKIFHGITCANMSGHVKISAKCVQHSPNMNESCADCVACVMMSDKILPHPGYTFYV